MEDRLGGFVLPSEEELKAGGTGDFKLLPEDEYVAKVESIEILKDQKSQYHPEAHDEWKVRFDLEAFSNQDPIYYEDNSEPDPTKPVRLSVFIDPSKVGMVPRPSKARKFITAALGVAVGDRTEMSGPSDLLGKRLLIRTIHKVDTNGKNRDRIDDFRPFRSRTRSAAAAQEPTKPTDEDVKADAESLLATAKTIFNDDLTF